VWLLTNKTTNI